MSLSSSNSHKIAFLINSEEEADGEQMLPTSSLVGGISMFWNRPSFYVNGKVILQS